MILTNIASFADAANTFSSIGQSFHYINDNLYNLAEQKPDIIITADDADAIAKEYPHIKFVFPWAKFPSYHSDLPIGFDFFEVLRSKGLSTEDLPPLKTNRNIVAFVNTNGHQSKLLAQRAKALFDVHIFGVGFGINEIRGNFNSCDIYRSYDTCITNSNKEVWKILALGKKCITDFNHPYTYHIDKLTEDKKNVPSPQIVALEQTYFDTMSEILNEADNSISEKLKEQKNKICDQLS